LVQAEDNRRRKEAAKNQQRQVRSFITSKQCKHFLLLTIGACHASRLRFCVNFFSFQLELKEERSNSESEVVFRVPQTLLLTLFLRYNPFGRPGAGAPLRDTGGRIIAVLSACFECYMRVSAHAA